MKRRGYSLIELLVVVAIIGILATVGTYAWASSGKRSRDSVRKSDIARMKNALQQHYLDSRVYPEFDSTQGNIFLAGWQLLGGTACAHETGKRVLTPKYLTDIPQDPKRSVDFTDAQCSELLNGSSHYLYLAGPKTGNAARNPREFALMATLEASERDRISTQENPIATDSGDNFGGYAVGLGESPNFFDANYIIKGSNGR